MSRDGKCPDIYECRMGVQSPLAVKLPLVMKIDRLKEMLVSERAKNKKLRFQRDNLKFLYREQRKELKRREKR